ncbi:unnamed protein product [Mytilus coruscus]|uniref:Uncharacterized protein n=1 Tax=Mytilus coruscus TaxID=42192 RepID=A0A6J8DG76_MYTCO|nr:unnamed protein product [Mytilus coruscus]
MGTVHQERYKGPYIIMKDCGKNNYLLIDTETKKQLGPFNQTSLKIWNEPESNVSILDQNNNLPNLNVDQESVEDTSCVLNEKNTHSVNIEAIVHLHGQTGVHYEAEATCDNENTEQIYVDDFPSAQSKCKSPLSSTSFDLFDVSLRDMFLPVEQDNNNNIPTDDITVIEQDIPVTPPRPKRMRKKKRQSSIYEYYS